MLTLHGFDDFRHLRIAATLALPERKSSVRIARALIHSAIRWNNLTAATRAGTSAHSISLNVNAKLVLVCHNNFTDYILKIALLCPHPLCNA